MKPQGDFISAAVAETVWLGGDEEIVEEGVVITGPGVSFDDTGSDRDGGTDDDSRRRSGLGGPTDDLEISVVSNCLIGAYRGSTVRLVQTANRMIILPQRPE